MTGAITIKGGSLYVAALATFRSLSRRRLTIAILVLLPVALYFARRDSTGQAIRSLLFGISWAVSTVAFFATTEASSFYQRLPLAGWSARRLIAGRIGCLLAVGLALASIFFVLVHVDQDVNQPVGVAVGLAMTVATAVSVGTTVGRLVQKEMEGALIIFLFAGLQAVLDPFGQAAKFLPFWSSGVLHGGETVAICLAISLTLELVGRRSCLIGEAVLLDGSRLRQR